VLSLSPHGRVHAVDWNIMSDEIGFIFGFGYGGSVLAACGLYSVLCLSPTES